MSGQSSARWGWYRLSEEFAAALVESSGVRPGDLVLDLGAGEGVITRHLADRDVRVIAFELHPRRAARLTERFDHHPSVKVVRADIADLRLPRCPFHVVANPPFGYVSSVLHRLTSRHSRLAGASFVLPIAVAVRWQRRLATSRTPWTLTIPSRVPRSALTPRPRVDCCIATVG